MKEKYYYKYRGNGYGPFDTIENAKSNFSLKLLKPGNEKYRIMYIYKGIVFRDKNKKLTDKTRLHLVDKVDKTWD